MIVQLPDHREPLPGSVAATADSASTRDTTRVILFAGAGLAAILLLLMFTTVEPPAPDAPASGLDQITRNTQLFHGPIPAFFAVPGLAFTALAWTCVTISWLVYLWVLYRLHRGYIDPWLATTAGLAVPTIALLVPSLFSTDVFSYAMFGRIAGLYDQNPYLTTAAAAASGDPLMPYLYWRDISSPYGPLWTLISEAVAGDPTASPFESVLSFKLIAYIAVIVDGWLIHELVRQRWPQHALWAYLAFTWNPLVLFEGIVTVHNDVVILMLLLVGAYLLARTTRWEAGVAALSASTLIKYSTVPVLGIGVTRLILRAPASRRLSLALRAALTVLLVAAAAFARYWDGFAALASTAAEPGRGLNNPILLLLDWPLRLISGGRLSISQPGVAVLVAATIFTAWQLAALRRDLRKPQWTIDDELAAWTASLLVFLLVWPRLHTWYFLVPVGLALAAGPAHRRLVPVSLTVAVGSYVTYFR